MPRQGAFRFEGCRSRIEGVLRVMLKTTYLPQAIYLEIDGRNVGRLLSNDLTLVIPRVFGGSIGSGEMRPRR